MQFAPRVGTIKGLSGDPGVWLAAQAAKVRYVRNPSVVRASALDGQGNEVSFDLTVEALTGEEITRANWEGHLFAGAVADRYRASGLDPIVAVDAALVTPDGRRQRLGGGFGSVVPSQQFRDVDLSVMQAVRTNAARLGLTDVYIETVEGLQDALVISIRAKDAGELVRGTARDGGLARSLLGSPATDYEGVYVQVSDEAGLAYVTATAPRAGVGFAWARPDTGLSAGRGPPR